MSVVISGDSPNLTSAVLSSPNITGTPVMGASVITSGTAVASTSGSSIDFTGIPSWVKRITIAYQAVSLNNSDEHNILLGTSGGFVNSGYAYACTNGTTSNTFTNGFVISNGASTTSYIYSGLIVLVNMGGNMWVCSSSIINTAAATTARVGNGYIALAAPLTSIRCTSNGTGTFDNGSINILYE